MEWVVLSAGRYGSECVEYSIHPLYIHSNFEVSGDSGNLKITNLDRLIFTKNGELTI